MKTEEVLKEGLDALTIAMIIVAGFVAVGYLLVKWLML
jgi:hypothetical protein